MDSYKLFLDKSNTFQCKLELEGASLDNALVRVILEGKNRDYLFDGKITGYGDCVVNLDKLNDIFKSGDIGNMRLEVIADDAYFAPWESSFEMDTAKKVRVEVINPIEVPKKPTIKVEIKQEHKMTKEEEFKKLVEFVINKVKSSGIASDKIKKNRSKLTERIIGMSEKCIYQHNPDRVLTEVLKKI